jgi:hypothetical protein
MTMALVDVSTHFIRAIWMMALKTLWAGGVLLLESPEQRKRLRGCLKKTSEGVLQLQSINL